MKHIFRKNQIIVTALALMIAAAGYVNYTYNMSEEDLASKAVDGEDDTMETAATPFRRMKFLPIRRQISMGQMPATGRIRIWEMRTPERLCSQGATVSASTGPRN